MNKIKQSKSLWKSNSLSFIIIAFSIFWINGCNLSEIVPDPEEAFIELSISEGDITVDYGEEVTLTGFATHSNGDNVEILWEIKEQPAGSTLTLTDPSENSISFTPDFLGDYIFRFTASSNDGLNEFEEITITVVKAPIRLSGTIDNDIILENIYEDPEDIDYLVSGILRINANVTISADVKMVFEEDGGITVNSNGSLKAAGLETAPILFTGAQLSKGFWKGLNFESSSSNNELSYTTVEYAGSGGFDGANRKANLTLNGGKLKISNCMIQNGGGLGILTRNIADELPEFTNNTISQNAGALEINKVQFHFLTPDNDFSGNEEDYVDSWGENTLLGNVTWRALNIPYRLRQGREYIGSDLIIEEGAEFVGQDRSAFYIEEEGSISAIGTETSPIIFRGDEDVPGYWEGFVIYSNTAKNIMDHVIIQHGGQKGANIFLDNRAKLTLKNSRVESSSDFGLRLNRVENELLSFSNNRFIENRIPIECKMNHFQYFDNESDLTGNEEDVIITSWADFPTNRNVTWKKTTVPYKITKTDFIQSEITIEPGAEFIFTDDSGIEVWDEGSIIAEGAPELPIIFRGSEDVQGYWRGITIFSKSISNIFSNVHVMNGGSKPYNGAKSNVIIWREARMQILDSSFTMSGGYGIGVGKDGLLTESGNTFANNLEGDIYFE